MTITLIILIITVAMFIWGKVRADIVALTALAALLVLGILTPAEALAGFSSPIVIMMIGLFVVGGAIMQTYPWHHRPNGCSHCCSSRCCRLRRLLYS